MTQQPLRVLVVHNRYRSGQPSGEDRVVDQEVAVLVAGGHEVSRFERRSDDIERMSLPRRATVPLRVPRNGAVRAELAARLRGERPDVVHVHNTFPLLSASVVQACADAGVPVVATLHNYLQVCPRGTLYRDGHVCDECTGRLPVPAVRHGCYRDSRLATLPLAATSLVNRSLWWTGVARFFCISTAQRQQLVQGGMPAERLQVKTNFVADPGVGRRGPGRHVLYVGRLTVEKGVPLLMAAWDRVAATGGIGLPLLIAGSGPLEDEVRRWGAGRDDVVVLGLRSAEEVTGLMADAATVVAPSAWLEAFGLVVVEAMAIGVPAVAAAHGAFVELVEEGVTGLLHRPGDAASVADCLRRIVLDGERNAAMGAAARRRYEERFTPEVGVAALTGGYRAAIAGPGGCEPI